MYIQNIKTENSHHPNMIVINKFIEEILKEEEFKLFKPPSFFYFSCRFFYFSQCCIETEVNLPYLNSHLFTYSASLLFFPFIRCTKMSWQFDWLNVNKMAPFIICAGILFSLSSFLFQFKIIKKKNISLLLSSPLYFEEYNLL